jgi:hypothetical protein
MLDRPVRLLVDRGVRSILLYRDRFAEQVASLRVEQRIRGSSLSGDASLEVVTLPRLQLNGTELERSGVLLRTLPAGVGGGAFRFDVFMSSDGGELVCGAAGDVPIDFT